MLLTVGNNLSMYLIIAIPLTVIIKQGTYYKIQITVTRPIQENKQQGKVETLKTKRQTR